MLEGSLAVRLGRCCVAVGFTVAETRVLGDDQRKTLPIAWKKVVAEVGTRACLRELERPVSTAALRRYAIAIYSCQRRVCCHMKYDAYGQFRALCCIDCRRPNSHRFQLHLLSLVQHPRSPCLAYYAPFVDANLLHKQSAMESGEVDRTIHTLI